ncbi:hypothetical protein [Schinkia azotoformans]|uniref:hypothetical protein n=1 Tax=Schinkia azotoformans TaxID=1454 RepID=UPI002DB7702F|nr:hypothetical protein [Schinkia azotoformans]MEC1714764.1 hypothetical protein [Schinkia azotoformans]MEC1757480.1 hypothetical protein [Schinkia azotoformans]
MDIGTLKAQIEANHRQFMAAITDMKKELKNVGSEAKKTGNDFDQLNNALSALGAGVAFNKISGAIKATVNEANKMQMAMQGLIEVTKSLNQDVEASTGLAQELASKGFMSVTEAAESVKTSLAMGLGLEETKNLVIALGDAAAYNRESHLGWGEAVVQAIRGIKMGESTLTDAAGITTNLSVMYERYADKIGTTAEKLTDAQKVQAAYNGMLQDAALFAGNAESALDGYQGSTARFNKSMSELKAEVGEAFMPIIADTLDALTPIIIELAKWASENEKLVVTIGGVSLGVTALISLLTAGAFAFNTLRTAAIGFQASLGPVGWVMAGLSIAATGLTVAYTNMADKTNEAKQAQEALKIASEENSRESINLASEYDNLTKKLSTLTEGTEAAKETKKRMSEIMSELEQKSPGLVSAYNNQTGAVKNMTKSMVENALAAVNMGKAHLDAMRQQTGGQLADVQKKLLYSNKNNLSYQERSELADKQRELQNLLGNYDIQENAINTYKKSVIDQYAESLRIAGKIVDTSTNKGGGGTGKSSGSSKSLQQTPEDIAKENYQESLRWVQYKKALNDLSVEEELAAYERLLNRYKQYNDIRMEMEERIYQTKGIMVQNSFEHSSEWIEKEEMRMRLSGKTDQEVAQMKIDAWERVRSRYAENTEYYKQADRELYNVRIQIMREAEQELKELERQREDAYKELKRSIINSTKEAEKAELESIRKRKEAELDVLRQREDAELDSLEKRKRAIEEFYSEQVESIEDEKTAEDKKKILDDIEKYKYATSKEGREKYNDLLAKLRDIERQEEKAELDKEKRDKLRALEDEQRDIKDSYKSREREIGNYYDKVYDSTQSHFDNLISEMESYTGSAEGFERLLKDSRISLNAEANSKILDQIRSFVDDYNDEMSRINSKSDEIRERVNESITDSKPSSSSNNNSNSNTNSSNSSTGSSKKEFTGWSMYDGSIKYSVDKNGYIYKNGNFVPADNYKWVPQEVINKASNVKKGIFHFGRDAVTGLSFSRQDELMSNEIEAIIQRSEYVFQQGQLDSLISSVGQNQGKVINYNAPLIEHNGDVHLEDDTDVKTYWRERELTAQRLLRGGERL